ERGAGMIQPGGWIYQILPFLDQGTLYDMGRTTGGLNPGPTGAAKRVSGCLPMLYCPTRRSGQPYPVAISGSGPGLPNNCSAESGRTDYVMNGGSVVVPSGAGPSSLQAAATNNWPNLVTLKFNGIAAVHSQVTDGDIKDNHAQTYLIGEKYLSPEHYSTGQDP